MSRDLRIWATGDWDGLAELREDLTVLLPLATDAATADVIVHAVVDQASVADEVAALREHAHAPVVLLAPSFAPQLLELTLAANVAETLILPQPVEALEFAVRKAAARSGGAGTSTGTRRGKIVTVFSPKGGTGKTVVACNLAVALAAEGRKTLLVDLDLQFGDVAIMLGLEPERTMHDLVVAPGSFDADKISGYATRHGARLDVLPAPLRPEDGELVLDARIAEILEAATHGYDVVVVDTAPFFHGAVLAALDRTDELLLVCVPDVPTMKNVRLTLQTLELLSFPADRVKLVLNRASARVGFRAAQVASVLERAVDYELPEDDRVAVGVNKGAPVVADRRNAPFAQALTALAAGVGAQPATAARRRRVRFALGRRG
jgi:pilus assembly protein CpaE